MSLNWPSQGARYPPAREHSDESLDDSFVMDQDDPALLEAFFNKHMVNRTLKRRHSYANSLYSNGGSNKIISPGLTNVPSKDLRKEIYSHASNASSMRTFNKSKSYYTQKHPRAGSEYSREREVDHAASEIIGKFGVARLHISNKKRHSPKERLYLMPEEPTGKIPSIVIKKEDRFREDNTKKAESGVNEYYNELLDDLTHGNYLDGGQAEDIKEGAGAEAVNNNKTDLFLKRAPSINLPFFVCGTGEDAAAENYEYLRVLKQIKNELPKIRKPKKYFYFDSSREQPFTLKKVGFVKSTTKKKGLVNSLKSPLRKDSKSAEHETFFEKLRSHVKSKKRHRRSIVNF